MLPSETLCKIKQTKKSDHNSAHFSSHLDEDRGQEFKVILDYREHPELHEASSPNTQKDYSQAGVTSPLVPFFAQHAQSPVFSAQHFVIMAAQI